jgi:manganese transport protein
VCVLVVAGIGAGNAAFETGNITGAAIGLAVLTGVPAQVWAVGIGLVVCVLLALGTYRAIERFLLILVMGMSLVFILTAILARPSVGDMISGLVWPSFPDGSALLIVALIGTTVVPYNLFLHANAVQERWAELPQQQALSVARRDACVSVSPGGVITLAIVSTAAAANFAQGIPLENAGMMASQLEPLLGSAAQSFFAGGLLCAGITSAITAPLAAAYATAGILGWRQDMQSWQLRAVWGSITLIGTLLAAVGQRPMAAIILAQAVNGLLLPIIAVFLLIVMNRQELLGENTNGRVANVCGGAVVFVVSALGLFQLWTALGRFFILI